MTSHIDDTIRQARVEAGDPGRIVRDVGVCGGADRFAGTRVQVSAVRAALAGGASDAALLTAFPTLLQADLDAARRGAGDGAFIIMGRPRVTPTMLFPAGTTYKVAKAAFETANPGFCAGDAFLALDDDDGEGPYEGDEGGFCEVCDRFMMFEDSHGDGDVSWCAGCERKRLEAEG